MAGINRVHPKFDHEKQINKVVRKAQKWFQNESQMYQSVTNKKRAKEILKIEIKGVTGINMSWLERFDSSN